MTSTGTIAATIRSVLAELPTDMLRSAKDGSAESAERIRCATTGTSHDAPQAALGSIADSIGEALDALDQVARRLDYYLSVLDLGDGITTSITAGSTGP